ncbi:MAG: hypothetical protein AAF823_14840 [Planctomycetota bacterium]
MKHNPPRRAQRTQRQIPFGDRRPGGHPRPRLCCVYDTPGDQQSDFHCRAIVKAAATPNLHPHLTPGAAYHVIGIEADDYRLLDDRGQPCLYPADHFEVIDPAEPADWIADTDPDGERYACPLALNAPGFLEDFIEANPTAQTTFWQSVNRRLAEAG